MNKLPFTYQDLLEWYQSRYYQPVEAYTHADKLWLAFSASILAEMNDAEVEHFVDALIAKHGEYNGIPNTTERETLHGLKARLQLIARRKAFAEQHQASTYRIKDLTNMVALYVHEMDWNIGIWKWEVIHDHVIDASGTEKTEAEAWAKAEEQWQISYQRLRLTQP